MPSKRNSLGRFEKKADEMDNQRGFTFPIPTGWSSRIIFIIGLVFLVSPWLFMMAKNNTLSGVSTKVNDFYETYFTCYCPTNVTANNTTTPTPKKDNGGSF